MIKSKKVKKTKNLFYKILSVVLAVVSAIFLGMLFYIDLIPTKYMKILVVIILIFNLFNIVLLNHNRLKKKVRKVLSSIVIFSVFIMLVACFYLSKTLNVLTGNGDSKYKLENYSVVVLKTSNYKELKNIKGKTIGYYKNSTGSEESRQYLGKKVNVDFKSYESSDKLIQDLLNSKVESILIENSIMDLMNEEIENFSTYINVIYKFSIKVATESTLKDVNVTKDSFAIYISGIDTYGKISSVSRSDVNIVAVVNPTIKQILLISIPRDYYVQLHGTTGTKDKLTHAGIYGIDMSIKTIEDLLDMDINYYVKVNFTSVIDIVNSLGGVDVYSDYSFISYSGYSFKKGYNRVNGEQALDFARTRKAFSDGDRQRGKNQQALIEAMIRKATSKSIITKYSSLLDAVDGKYQTNMGMKKITSIIKKQLDEMSSWTITSYSLTGTDSSNYTYTYNQLLYVMQPDQKSVDEAKELINKVLNNEKLDSSYSEMTGSSSTVTKAPVPSETPKEEPKEEPKDTSSESSEKDKEKDDNLEDVNDDLLIPKEEPKDTPDTDNKNSDDETDKKDKTEENDQDNPGDSKESSDDTNNQKEQ